MIGQFTNTFSKEVVMKRSAIILGVVALSIMLIVPVSANDLKKELGEARYNKAVENLLVALKESNTNDGLRRSAIYQLGELQADDAVIPIMAVLRRCHDEKCRVAAAWALCKIGDSRGTYAVKQAVRFDDSKKVQLHSAWYYNLYVSEGTFAFIPSESAPTQIAELR
jgi:HEAT repeat protein